MYIYEYVHLHEVYALSHIVNFPVVEISINQTSYTVSEDVGQLGVWISITSGEKAPGQECEIEVTTDDGSAQGKLYFTPRQNNITIPASNLSPS